MSNPILLPFASGTAEGGGSGFEKLVEAMRDGRLHAVIPAVVTNHKSGGVAKRAERLGIRRIYFPAPYTAERYRAIIRNCKADFVALSGWIKPVYGHDPRTTINVHPALLYPPPYPRLGGKGMWGHHVHEEVHRLYHAAQVTETGLSMHFATAEYDSVDTVFLRRHVEILPGDTPDDIGNRVNQQEHIWQLQGTEKVVTGEIYWDGVYPSSLQVPDGWPVS